MNRGALRESLRRCTGDLRQGAILLRRDRGASLLVVLVLASGIAGAAAMFTLFKAAVLDPLPYPDADRLITIVQSIRDPRLAGGVNILNPSVAQSLEIRELGRSLEETAVIDHVNYQLAGSGEPTRLIAARVSSSFFSLLGAGVSLGRVSPPEENFDVSDPVVLSNDFWRIHMGADSNAIGKTLRLNGEPHVVIGVLAAGFAFDYPALRLGGPADIYLRFPLRQATDNPVRVLAKIRSQFTLSMAGTELDGIARMLHAQDGGSSKGMERTFRAVALRDAIVGNQPSLLRLLMAGAGLLLLVACANTSQVLLARSLARSREVAIRSALGAGRMQLCRQFLIEGLALSLCAGALGFVFCHAIVRAVIAFLPFRSPVLEAARTDAQVVVFAVAVSVLSSAVFGMIPAIKGSAGRFESQLKTNAGMGQDNGWRHLMISIEAALSVFLLCGAALIARNLWTLVAAPRGFDSRGVLLLQLRLPADAERTSQAYQAHLQQVAAIPGFDSVAVGTAIPLRPGNGGFTRIAGQPAAAMATRKPAWSYFVGPGFFRTLKIPLIAGRDFRDDDSSGRPLVAVVNREFVRSHELGPDPLGRQIDDGPGGLITIVGVVEDVRVRGTQPNPEPQLYLSYLQFFQPDIYLIVRSSLPQSVLVAGVKAAIHSADSEQPVFNISTMDQLFSSSIAAPRFNALLVGAFALSALVIAAGGIYSVISCLVSQRTGEIALRIALGAPRAAVISTVIGTTMAWVAAGVAAGFFLAVVAGRMILVLSNSVIDASPALDAVVLVVFLAAALSAAFMPVRRAIRLDPVRALRCE